MQGQGEISFARKASGLVRGLSFWDAFGVGFMNQGLTPSIWVMISLGLGVYLGGNLIIATIISVVLAGIGFPIVWGILGGSMPRSGGEYIYNSRIIHPLIGIGESFGNAFIWLMWIYVLAPWMADPGAVMLSEFMGWKWLYDPAAETFLGGLSYSWGSFVIATIASVIAFGLVAFGIKIFARAQKVVMTLGTAWRPSTARSTTTTSSPRPVRQPARACRRAGTGETRSASWSPARGCSPTPTASLSSPAK
jgi:APA family basic amino acid/polyamine antiporter